MKSKLLTSLISVMLVITCLFTLTACGGIGNWFKPSGGDDDDNNEVPASTLFSTDSWATIAQVAASGKAYEVYDLGDEKTVTLSTGEEVTFLILGFSHDDLADGTGRAGITIGMKDLLSTKYQMTGVVAYEKWSACLLRTETLPMIFNQLPAELRTVIKTVKKDTPLGTSTSAGWEMTEDKLFLLSKREIADDSMYPAGAQYAYWRKVKDGKAKEDKIKYLGGTGAASDWFHRYILDMSHGIDYVGSDGGFWSTSATGMTAQKGLNFAFCV